MRLRRPRYRGICRGVRAGLAQLRRRLVRAAGGEGRRDQQERGRRRRASRRPRLGRRGGVNGALVGTAVRHGVLPSGVLPAITSRNPQQRAERLLPRYCPFFLGAAPLWSLAAMDGRGSTPELGVPSLRRARPWDDSRASKVNTNLQFLETPQKITCSACCPDRRDICCTALYNVDGIC